MGSVVDVDGSPVASGPNGSRTLSAGSSVFEGETINVGSGNAQLLLDDGTKIVVGPSSRLVLQAYLRRGGGTASKVGVKALRGTFRFITGKSPKSAYNIATSTATIGIRGTGFDFTVNRRTVLAVMEGAVRLRGSNGQVVNTKSGCGVAEAGPNTITAKELEGQPKSDALKNELPYVIDQSPLNRQFHLPVANCVIFLGENGGGAAPSGINPTIALPAAAGAVGAGVFIYGTLNKEDNPASSGDRPPAPDAEDGFCNQDYYITDPDCFK